MHQVLLISEIVTHIFYYLTNKADQFTAIRICKAWFDIGIDHLWRDIEDVRFIFRILAPIVKSSYGTWVSLQIAFVIALRLTHLPSHSPPHHPLKIGVGSISMHQKCGLFPHLH